MNKRWFQMTFKNKLCTDENKKDFIRSACIIINSSRNAQPKKH